MCEQMFNHTDDQRNLKDDLSWLLLSLVKREKMNFSQFIIASFIIEKHWKEKQCICFIMLYPFIGLLSSIKNDDLDLYVLIATTRWEKKRKLSERYSVTQLKDNVCIYECMCPGKNLNGHPHNINSSCCMLLKSLYGNFLYIFPYYWDVLQLMHVTFIINKFYLHLEIV